MNARQQCGLWLPSAIIVLPTWLRVHLHVIKAEQQAAALWQRPCWHPTFDASLELYRALNNMPLLDQQSPCAASALPRAALHAALWCGQSARWQAVLQYCTCLRERMGWWLG